MKGNTGAARLGRARKESEGMKLHRELQIAEDEEMMSRPWDFSPKEKSSLRNEPPANHSGHIVVHETVGSTSMVKKVPPHRIFLAFPEEDDLGLWEHQTNRVQLEKEECLFDIGTALHEQALQLEVQAFELEAMAIGLGHTREWLTKQAKQLESREVELDSRELELEDHPSIVNQKAKLQAWGDDLWKRSSLVELREKELADVDQGLSDRNYKINKKSLELRERKEGQINTEKDLKRRLDKIMARESQVDDREVELLHQEWKHAKQERLKFSKSINDPQSSELREFERFPDLPTELRLKIWECVETDYDLSRFHTIFGIPYHLLKSKQSYHSDTRHKKDKNHIGIYMMRGKRTYDRVAFMSPHGIHPILHACKESRSFATKYYNLTFAFGTYLNFKSDTIFLDETRVLFDSSNPGLAAAKYLITRPEETKLIKNLAIIRGSHSDGVSPIANALKDYLGSLEEVTFVLGESRKLECTDSVRAGQSTWLAEFDDDYSGLQLYAGAPVDANHLDDSPDEWMEWFLRDHPWHVQFSLTETSSVKIRLAAYDWSRTDLMLGLASKSPDDN